MSRKFGKIFISALFSLIILTGFFVAWDFTADDSYITFRYSKHLSEGRGLVFNPGDSNPVEGYTNFLWMIIMTIPHFLGWSPIIFSKIIGLLCYCGCGLTLYQYTRFKTGSSFWGCLATVPLIILPSTYFHTISGMETILYDFILLLVFISGYEIITSAKKPTAWQIAAAPALVLLAGMTRPEGLLPGLIALLVIYYGTRRVHRKQLLRLSFFLLFLPGLIYFIWRVTYFGWLLPNTFYVKFGQPFNGIEWLAKSFGSLAGIIIIAILSYATGRHTEQKKIITPLYYFVFLIMAILAYSASNLMMNYMNRFLFHILPVVFLILALELHTIFSNDSNNKSSVPVSCGYIFAIVIICTFPLLHRDKTETAHMALYESHLNNAHIKLANELKQVHLPQELKTLAVGDAGAIPYYSEWVSYDFVGLNDEYVAHNPSDKSDFIMGKKPTLLILYSENGTYIDSYQFGFEPHPRLSPYDEIGYIKWFPDYYLGVYLRNDIDSLSYIILTEVIRGVQQEAQYLNADSDNRAGLIKHLKKRIGL
ncbi:MAG: hypothetical protein V3V99_14215 [candidate division Zixibacteria bacterium]